jgi:prohibitin 2
MLSVLLFLAVLGLLAVAGFSLITREEEDRDGYPRLRFHPVRAFPWFAAAAAVWIIWLGVVTVSTGARGVVLRFQRVTGRTLEPGIHLINPFTDSVREVIVQTRIVQPEEQAASHDLQIVHMKVTLGYYPDPEYAGYIVSQLNDDAETRVVIPSTLEGIKAVTAQYDAEQLIAKRASVRNGIEDFVRGRLTTHHIILDSVSITDFNFSQEYNQAIEAKVTAQQQALKAQNDLTRIKVEADQRVARAEAEAKELKLQREQISPELIQLRMMEKWNGQLPDVVMGGPGVVPMMDVMRAAGKKKE